MPLQGMVFVRAWAKATTSNPFLSLHFFFQENQSQRALHTSLQLRWLDPKRIQGLLGSTGVQLREYKRGGISTLGLLLCHIVWSEYIVAVPIMHKQSSAKDRTKYNSLKTSKHCNGLFQSRSRVKTAVRGKQYFIRLSFCLVNSHLTKSNYHWFRIFLKPRFRFSLIVEKP